MLNFINPVLVTSRKEMYATISAYLESVFGYTLEITNYATATGNVVYWIHSVGTKHLLVWMNLSSDGSTTNTSNTSLYLNGFLFLNDTVGFTGDETSLSSSSLLTLVLNNNTDWNVPSNTSELEDLPIARTRNGGGYGYPYHLLTDSSESKLIFQTSDYTSNSEGSTNGICINERDGKLLIWVNFYDYYSSSSGGRYLVYDMEDTVLSGGVQPFGQINSNYGIGVMLQNLSRCFGTRLTGLNTNYNCFSHPKIFLFFRPQAIYEQYDTVIKLNDGSVYYRMGKIAYQISSGSGDSGGSSGGTSGGSSGSGTGTNNYNDLNNKPSINNVTLSGNKTLNDLNIQAKGNYVQANQAMTNEAILAIINNNGGN